ncbi:SusD/RagB family nutrient-binding outer membrane lipoprotein [Jiulongibacter sediminis]|uniref:SusD/RagB family nutrient-binding outer membrane lipoprotein n=1 Tax=Jiulongibacter sediminis TaxID=1605367 RepID=A0A0P7C610_9BACT|nr:SusD/RagB family nutrient-binding outer membrane lipoprotein [Jiulongibacter sediminis]KPM48784.1 hypothetical protein AFM12_09395 [Jiulongibacter sediminis]TBX25316.1 hypothetical protein TK44_09400 [Jiulongibacter sediminis]
MKRIYSLLITGLLLFSATSCDERLANLNVDPDNSPTASDAQVLTSALGYMSYVQDVELNMNSFLWAQYYTWGIGVSIGNQERFVSEPDDFNNYWIRSYAQVLTDVKFLTKSDSKAYSGIGKVLMAYMYQGLVDHFGSVPFSEALNGEIADGSILTPSYDSPDAIYASLVTLLDEAIADLDVAPADAGADDLVYGGDLEKWTKFANSLKLRILMRTSETAPNAAAIQALISSGSFIESMSDIAKVDFSGATGNQNPMFARMTWGVGDFYFASNATVNKLNELADPRLTAFYTPASSGTFNGQIRGIDQGSIDNEPFTAPATDYSGSSPVAVADDNSVFFMSPWEVWFLRAEAAARYGTADDASAAFATAISSNFSFLGVDGASDYIASLGFDGLTSLDDQIDAIAVQKWISLNGTQEDEGWIETRRFDRPASRVFTEGIFQTPTLTVLPQGVFPSTWLYPETERSLNANAPAQRTITDKIFWDN